MKCRKKPVEVEAKLLTSDNGEELAKWCAGTWHPTLKPGYTSSIRIATLEGTMEAKPGDWIIKGVKGEFYPCKADIFAATYDLIPHTVMVCGVDCYPGDGVCNNYCNLAPQKGPMADAPPQGPDAEIFKESPHA